MMLLISFIVILILNATYSQTWISWPNNTPPSSIPFSKSTDILGWEYLNASIYNYGGAFVAADTWYPTWSKDGNLYSPFTDGTIILSNNKGG